MAEEYSGVKFKTVMKGTSPPVDARIEELRSWCKAFHEQGLAPEYPGGSYGNLSFRISDGSNSFIITGTCIGMKGDLNDDCFVTVEECDFENRVIYANGTRLPSSESMMHYAVYKQRPDIRAIFHGHSPEILKLAEERNLPITPEEHPYGSLELAHAVAALAASEDFFIIRNHGFVALGEDLVDAGVVSMFWQMMTRPTE
jgi:ribulose-5-phosphate 4-epimerase/fuculose-1-phosphate aldolase